jgi:hypothetical protein
MATSGDRSIEAIRRYTAADKEVKAMRTTKNPKTA